jgi:hypothetical protein
MPYFCKLRLRFVNREFKEFKEFRTLPDSPVFLAFSSGILELTDIRLELLELPELHVSSNCFQRRTLQRYSFLMEKKRAGTIF